MAPFPSRANGNLWNGVRSTPEPLLLCWPLPNLQREESLEPKRLWLRRGRPRNGELARRVPGEPENRMDLGTSSPTTQGQRWYETGKCDFVHARSMILRRVGDLCGCLSLGDSDAHCAYIVKLGRIQVRVDEGQTGELRSGYLCLRSPCSKTVLACQLSDLFALGLQNAVPTLA